MGAETTTACQKIAMHHAAMNLLTVCLCIMHIAIMLMLLLVYRQQARSSWYSLRTGLHQEHKTLMLPTFNASDQGCMH